MKLAVVGSRSIKEINIERYVGGDVDEIVSGGAVGVDSCAAEYARSKKIKLTEFHPQYARFGRAAPLMRNREIVDYSDKILVFWDGVSKGARHVTDYAKKVGKPCEIILCKQG